MSKKLKPGLKIILGIVFLLLIVAGAFLVYVSDYYPADMAMVKREAEGADTSLSLNQGALIFDSGKTVRKALIFYPGGKVDYRAYEPLMRRIAQKGVRCILVKMPFHLAVFDIQAAKRYLSQYPEIEHWYIGGHSLGGSMAAEYAAKNKEQLKGLILLSAYSSQDISDSGLKILSIYGTKDGVLNKTSYKKNESNLPKDSVTLVLEGANHAGFGCYGPQKKDGIAEMSPSQQQEKTAQAIIEFCALYETSR